MICTFTPRARGFRLPVRLLGALVLVTGTGSTVLADEVSFTDTIPLTTTNWIDTLSLPKFDPQLGMLTGATLRIEAEIQGQAGFENLDPTPATIEITWGASIVSDPQGPLPQIELEPELQFVQSVSGFDGTIDFGGTSGASLPNLGETSEEVVVATPANLMQFVGPGNLTMQVTATSTCQAIGAANIVFQCMTQATASATVTYTFAVADCDNDGIPDTAEPDSDGDGIPDDCDRTPVLPAYNRPASLLVYPLFDNRMGSQTIFTVTNTDRSPFHGDRRVEFTYRSRYGPMGENRNCTAFDRTEVLTPGDTFSVFTNFHAASFDQGFAYATAVDGQGRPVAANVLIGGLLGIDGISTVEFAVPCIQFRAVQEPGVPTDIDGDGLHDLNGVEYDPAPGKLLFPRFLGSGMGRRNELILLNLSGGAAFDATADFIVYNDNEENFTTEHTYRCWERIDLLTISQIFGNDFLRDFTNQDPMEVLGAPQVESGWFQVDGAFAASSQATIQDPALLGLLIEISPAGTSAASLPFYAGSQDNGDLYSISPFADANLQTAVRR